MRNLCTSRLLQILMIVLATGLVFTGGWLVGRSASPIQSALRDPESAPAASQQTQPQIQETKGSNISFASSTPDGLVNNFFASKYRVLKIAKNEKSHTFLIVATRRSELCENDNGSARCSNDTACGSIYTEPTCYFFSEPDYYANVDPKPRFLTRSPENFGGFGFETSITFPTTNTAVFTTRDGDGGYGVEKTYELDLTAATLTEIAKKEINN